MKTPPFLTRLLPSLVAAGIITTAFSASSATNLIHRYSFNEPLGSTTVIDSIRGSNGVARATPVGSVPTFDGSQVTLDGGGGYIDLPNRMLAGLTNVSFEFWVTWTTGGTWARLLDFGFNANGEDTDGTKAGAQGSNYVFITSTAGTNPRFAIAPASNESESQINSSTNLTLNEEHHVVVTYGPNRAPSMYIDGNFVGSGNFTFPLSVITNDVNCWLGRSQWADPFFGGSFNEFRMHSTMLGQLEVLASKASGPNTINYTPENPTSITLNVISNMTSGQSQNATITGVFPTYGTVTIGATEATLATSASGIVRVDANNRLTAVAPGTATITASLGGQTNFGTITVVPPAVAVNALKHRYSFNEPAGSTTVTDSIAGANGTVVPPIGTTPPVVISNNVANFPGGGANATCGYITLPSDMLTTEFTNITVEVWFTWNAGTGSTWQRLFDFGASNKGSDPHINNSGRDYIMFTPQRGGNGARTEFRTTLDSGANYTSSFNDAPATGPLGFPTNREVHVVCTFAPAINYSALYIDGRVQAINTTPVINGVNVQFNQLSSPNMWLGVSQWFDPPLNGAINELRLHEGLLNEVQIALSRQAGPNALPVSNPGTLQSVALQTPPLFINNPIATQATLLGNYQNVSNVDITPFTGVTLQSTDTNIFTVSAAGLMTPVSVGTASLIGTYNSLSTTSQVSVLAPTSLSLNNLPATLDVGDPATTTYPVPLFANFPGGITNVNVTAFTGVTRSSSDTNVATITAAGVITVLNPGSTTITSTYAGLSIPATLTVLAPISLSVTNLPGTREAGSVNFAVPLLAAYSDGHSNIVVSAAVGVVRSSSNPNAATISGGGTITVRSPGVTTITSSYRGLTNQATLTVVTPANFVRGTLLHRYSFSEAADTPTVHDSVGTADGTVVSQQTGLANGNFTGAGEFMFGPGAWSDPPVTNAYINLPNRLISTLSSVTVEGWFTWNGGANNQHLFDFGISSGAPDGSGGTSSTNFLEDFVLNPGRNYFFLSPQTGNPRFALDPDIGGAGIGETPSITSSIAITVSNKSHFAVVYDFPRGVARLYINGQRAGTGAAVYPLSVVDDRNDWLGHSQWQDPFYNGSIDEFRIYNGPMLDDDVAANFATGPNALPVPKVPLGIALVGANLQISWTTNVPASAVLQATPTLGIGILWSSAGLPAPTIVGDKYQVTVPVSGAARYYRLGQ
jgi:hypothetical protein